MYGNSLVGIVTAPLDRLMLGFFSGTAAVGVLMVVKTLYNLPGIFLQMFLSIIAPMFSSAHAQEEKNRNQHLYHVCTDWLMRLSLPLIIFLWLFAEEVLLLFGKEFPQQGHIALKLFLVGQTINLGTGPIGNLLNMSGLEKVMFRLSVVQSVFMVIAIALSVPFWGINGAAFAIALGTLFTNLAALWIGRRNLSLRWWDDRYKRWFMLTLLCIGIGVLSKRFIAPIAAPQLVAILFALYIISHGVFIIQGLHADDKEIWLAIRSKFAGVTES